MVFVISMMIGAVAANLRSTFAYAVVAFLIVLSFAVATLLSGQAAHWANLALAIVGYNAGIASVITAFVLGRRRLTQA